MAVIARVLAGSATISATSGVLHASAATTLAAEEVKPITLVLESTGSITGIVYGPDGQTPAAGARVSTSIRSFTTGADGAYQLDGLPLTTTYSLSVIDASGRLRAKTTTPIQIPFGVPTTPLEVIVGVPCDLLRRRPDVRRAERQVAAQLQPAFGGVRGRRPTPAASTR